MTITAPSSRLARGSASTARLARFDAYRGSTNTTRHRCFRRRSAARCPQHPSAEAASDDAHLPTLPAVDHARSFCGLSGSPLQFAGMSAAGNLAAWLIESALSTGAGPRVALREGDRKWTFDELATHVGKLSAALRTLKLGRGERVLILM